MGQENMIIFCPCLPVVVSNAPQLRLPLMSRIRAEAGEQVVYKGDAAAESSHYRGGKEQNTEEVRLRPNVRLSKGAS